MTKNILENIDIPLEFENLGTLLVESSDEEKLSNYHHDGFIDGIHEEAIFTNEYHHNGFVEHEEPLSIDKSTYRQSLNNETAVHIIDEYGFFVFKF